MATSDTSEPQSYGSQADWVSGDTGQSVNRQKGVPTSEHSDFYSPHRESDTNAPGQGGQVSPVQAVESAPAASAAGGEEKTHGHKTSAKESGAKRDSYFKERDYK